jgi:hypothetical protein
MRAFVVLAGATVLLAGCGSEQKRVEDVVRNQLSASGTVSQVSMTKQGDGSYQGNATVRMADGHDARVNCLMRPNGSGYQGTCGQVIDQQLIDATKAAIRQQYTSQGVTVVELELAQQDADHMAGHALLRDQSGAEQRVNCMAPRDPTNGRFGLTCEGAGAPTQAAAPAEQAAPAEGAPEAPADDAH